MLEKVHTEFIYWVNGVKRTYPLLLGKLFAKLCILEKVYKTVKRTGLNKNAFENTQWYENSINKSEFMLFKCYLNVFK